MNRDNLHTQTCMQRYTHTHTDVCAQPAVIFLAIPMNYVPGKWKCAVELVTPGAFFKKAVLGSVQRDIPGTYWLMINWLIVSTLQNSRWSLDGGNTAALHTTSCQSVQNGNLEKLLDRSSALLHVDNHLFSEKESLPNLDEFSQIQWSRLPSPLWGKDCCCQKIK